MAEFQLIFHKANTLSFVASDTDNLDYNSLKHEIKTHTTRNQATAIAIPGQQDQALRKFEDGLYLELCRQHDRVGLFVTSKADEISRRLGTLHLSPYEHAIPNIRTNMRLRQVIFRAVSIVGWASKKSIHRRVSLSGSNAGSPNTSVSCYNAVTISRPCPVSPMHKLWLFAKSSRSTRYGKPEKCILVTWIADPPSRNGLVLQHWDLASMRTF